MFSVSLFSLRCTYLIQTFGLFCPLCFNVRTVEQKTESAEEPSEVKSQQKSQGIKKNKKKARLIIRNLSFKVSDHVKVKCCEA